MGIFKQKRRKTRMDTAYCTSKFYEMQGAAHEHPAHPRFVQEWGALIAQAALAHFAAQAAH